MEFTDALDSPFSLEYTLDSGQVFRWERSGDWWSGVVGGSMLKVRQVESSLQCVSGSDSLDSVFVGRYFRLEDDLDHALASVSKDEVLTTAIEKFYGLRLISQDRWECLASFVLATNANIPRIKKMVAAVSEEFGAPFEFEGSTYHSFPTPQALAGARQSKLAKCGLGYRAPFLRRVARAVAEGAVDFEALASLGYEESHKMLLSELLGEKLLLGVGPKVADCVLLYAFGKDEAFPIDVWIARVLTKSYPRLVPRGLRKRYARDGAFKLSPVEYAELSRSARSYFGPYAGYAQQYLFMAARTAG